MRPAVLLLLLAGAAPAADPARRALLVGVTKYPNLAARFQLAGPANDVKLMRQTLADKFQFRPADIVTLSEADGTADPAKLPTRANIEREFQRLAATAAAGDTVFILMGGHGSQQPENHRPGAEPEPDGLDEVFLPRDVGAWDDKVGAVANAIIDDDLGAWLQAIRAKGASVCVVLDACHSGTMTRGGGGEQLRQLDAEADLGIPKAALDKARGAAADRPGEKTRGGGPAVEPPAFKLADKGGLVALYAAQASEPTAECDLPPKAARPERYGLLTFAVCSALTQAVENQSKPLTYRELAQRVHQQYAGWGRTFPTPVLEGGDRDREFLGDTVWPGRSQYTLAKTPAGGWAVNAGSVHGLTPNSLFDVLPPPGGGDQPVGQVRVTDVRPTGCDVEPLDPAAKLPAGGACKVARIDYGAMKLRVAVDPIDDADRPTPEPLRAKLLATVAKLGGDESLIEPVADPAKADWLVRALPDGRAVLAPAAGAVKGSATATKGPAFGPVPADAKLGKWLADALGSISKADNLKAVAGREDGGEGGPQVTLKLTVAGKPVTWPSPDLVVFDKDKVEIRLTNPGKAAVDVTLLYVDSEYKIDPLFPEPGKNEYNRLAAGETTAPIRFDANSKTTGQEHLIVLGVVGSGPTADFAGLAQPGLQRLRAVGGKAAGLQQLLNKAAFGEGTRGLSRDADGPSHVTKLLTWQVKPGKRPAK